MLDKPFRKKIYNMLEDRFLFLGQSYSVSKVIDIFSKKVNLTLQNISVRLLLISTKFHTPLSRIDTKTDDQFQRYLELVPEYFNYIVESYVSIFLIPFDKEESNSNWLKFIPCRDFLEIPFFIFQFPSGSSLGWFHVEFQSGK